MEFELLWRDNGLANEVTLYSFDEVVGALRVLENYRILDLSLKLYLPDK